MFYCFQLTEVFTETHKALEETSDQLTATRHDLAETCETLQVTSHTLKVTEQDRDEHRFLVSEHVKTEETLFSDTNQVPAKHSFRKRLTAFIIYVLIEAVNVRMFFVFLGYVLFLGYVSVILFSFVVF